MVGMGCPHSANFDMTSGETISLTNGYLRNLAMDFGGAVPNCDIPNPSDEFVMLRLSGWYALSYMRHFLYF